MLTSRSNLILEIDLLGFFQVRVSGHIAPFRTDAERVLLAYLAAQQGIGQRRDSLAGLLSPERPDIEALTYLRNRLSRLRTALGDEHARPSWFDADRKQIALRHGDDILIDLSRFEEHLAAVEAHAHRQLADCPSCLARLQAAVQFVRGELLAGLNFPSEPWQSWLLTQREHYHMRALEALSWLREARLLHGDWAAVLDIAQRQLSLEAWIEPAHRAIMIAHYQRGDRAAALAQYEQCQQSLWDELGVEPEEETQQLRQRILDHELLVLGRPHIPDNLPIYSGLFFGRETEQAQLLQRLVDPGYRLISIVGAGGMGKTRLAIELGKQLKASFPDGVYFVALDTISGASEQIKIGIGEAIAREQHGQQITGDQVFGMLRDKRILLIFDNCELVLDELAFIAEWLRRAAQLTILATSREPLNLQAESVILLDGLGIGGRTISAAEAMFAERGHMAWDGFVVSAEQRPLVLQICELLNGSPLGIALAAAWVRRRSLAQIRDGISHSLDFLSTRLRDIDPRQRSMRAVFETSWQLLKPEEQEVLAALSVFPAPFTFQAAVAVTGARLPELDTLCEKSLLQQQQEPERYHMHSLLRQFAAEKISTPSPNIDRAFVDYFYQFASTYQHDYDALQPEWPNLAASISKAHGLGAWQRVLELVQHLDEPWFRQIRFNDMREGLTLALDAASSLHDQQALARTLLRLGQIEMELNIYADAEAHLLEATRQYTHMEDSLGIAQAKYLLGRIKNEQAQDEQALALFEESRDIFEKEQDLAGVARNLNLIAVCQAKRYRNFELAQLYLEQSVALQEQLALSPTNIETFRNLARVTAWTDNYGAAEQHLARALALSKRLADLGEYAAVLYEYMLIYKRRHQYDAALEAGYEALESFKKLGSLRWEALIKTQLGLLHQTRQQHDQSQAFLNEALELFYELGDIYEQAYCYYYIFRLHEDRGEMEHSSKAREQARRLNMELNDPQLSERLA